MKKIALGLIITITALSSITCMDKKGKKQNNPFKKILVHRAGVEQVLAKKKHTKHIKNELLFKQLADRLREELGIFDQPKKVSAVNELAERILNTKLEKETQYQQLKQEISVVCTL